jgi:hypothetical protein
MDVPDLKELFDLRDEMLENLSEFANPDSKVASELERRALRERSRILSVIAKTKSKPDERINELLRAATAPLPERTEVQARARKQKAKGAKRKR